MQPTERFSNRAAWYVQSRPGYPGALVELLTAEAGLHPSHILADLGAGTGLSSLPFLLNGNRVHAIEPNAEMRAELEKLASTHPALRVHNATAEATTLATHSIDFLIAGTAFHWFNAAATRTEALRILKPDSSAPAAIFWNVRHREASPLVRDYEALLTRFAPAYSERLQNDTPQVRERLEAFFSGPYQTRHLPNHQLLDLPGLTARLLSSSFAPLPNDPNHAPLLSGLHDVFTRHAVNGQVLFPYDLAVYFGTLSH